MTASGPDGLRTGVGTGVDLILQSLARIDASESVSAVGDAETFVVG
jgi:hypothetical protein